MARFVARSELPCSAQALYAWHGRPGAFERLVPPWDDVQVRRREGGIEPGGRLVMRVRRGPLRFTWEALHHALPAGEAAALGFVDEQVRGPFARWEHTHRFSPVAAGGRSTLEDAVEYRLPLHPVSQWIAGRSVRRTLGRMFAFRHRRTVDDMNRHAKWADRPRRTVAITGASGLLGTALAALLTTGGHRVRPLVRRAPRSPDEIQWAPADGHLDTASLEGVDAVVHLAGENVASGRWTDERKRAIRDSRVQGTTLLARALAGMARPPQVLVSASAIGWYGDRGAEPVDERSGPGEGFLADVCQAWEAATGEAEQAGIRTVHLRTGVVLSPSGGALAKMRTPFALGAGGPIGGGAQGFSWIALDDIIGLIYHALMDTRWRGPFNGTAPEPVSQRDFARALGRAMRRPAVAPLPSFVVRALFGEMGESVLLRGAFVQPRRALDGGFEFRYPSLDGALAHLLGVAEPSRS